MQELQANGFLTELPGIYQFAISMSEAEMAEAFRTAREIDSLKEASVAAELAVKPGSGFSLKGSTMGWRLIPRGDCTSNTSGGVKSSG